MRRAALVASIVLLAAAVAAPAHAAAPRRLVVVSLPGVGAGVLEGMLAERAMPTLAAWRREGASATLTGLPFGGAPASSQAMLWTGALGNVNGVTGTYVPAQPASRHAITEALDGWNAATLTAEPLYVAAARAGKQVLAFHVPHATPADAVGGEGRWAAGAADRLAVIGAEAPAGADGVWTEKTAPPVFAGWWPWPGTPLRPMERELKLAGDRLYAVAVDDPEDPASGYDTLLVTRERHDATVLARLKPAAPMAGGAWSGPVTLRSDAGLVAVYLRLFALSPDGRELLLYHTAPTRYQANRPAWVPALMQGSGPHVVGGAEAAYRAGALGPTVAEGGDGTAEARYLDTVHHALFQSRSAFGQLLAEQRWDLALTTVAVPGEALAMWLGHVTPGAPGYDGKLAEQLRPVLRRVFGLFDSYLGAVRAAAPKGTTMAVVSASGRAPVRWDFFPNVVLRQKGLLALGPDGGVDLARTKAYFPPYEGGYMLINTTDRRGGIVPPAQVAAVVQEVRSALGAWRVKTPNGVVPLVRLVEPKPPHVLEWGLGGPQGGQLYVTVQAGYGLNAALEGDQAYMVRPTHATGARVIDPRRAEARGLFVAVGDPVKRGASVKALAGVDVAPTLSTMLGVPSPADATGRPARQLLR